MANSTQTTVAEPAEADLNIPDEVKAKFHELIELIQKSQSMNQEERQYWIDVLPIMTEDQITNLRSILVNEKNQIDEANHRYEEEVRKPPKLIPRFDAEAYRTKKQERLEKEKQHELEEREHEKAVLKELENM